MNAPVDTPGGPVPDPPVFVGGFRSGTTLLINYLGLYPAVSAIYETKFLVDLLRVARLLLDENGRGSRELGYLSEQFSRPALTVSEAVDLLIQRAFDDVAFTQKVLDGRVPDGKAAHERYVLGSNHILWTEAEAVEAITPFVQAVRDRSASGALFYELRSAVVTLFTLHAKREGKRRWVNKTPEIPRFHPELRYLLGRCRFIHLIRDGRDVVNSSTRLNWWSPALGIVSWKIFVEEVRSFGALTPEDYLEIRYEEMVTDHAKAVQRVLDFLGLPGSAEDLVLEQERAYPGTTSPEMARQRIGRWRVELSRDDQTMIEEVAGDLLRRLGYQGSRTAESRGEGVRVRPELTLRLYRPGDEEGILTLFHRVFGQPRSLAHWRWKYPENPAGPPFLAVAEDNEGEIVGHYAVLRAWGQVAGGRRQMVQVIDSMVDPAYRQGLKKPGLFVQLALFYFDRIDREKVSTPDLRWMGYGFPNVSALRIGERLLGYTPLSPVGRLVISTEELTWRLPPSGAEVAYRVREVSSVDARADRLWSRCAPELPTAIIRDQTYLNWRYRDAPDQTYRVLLAENRFTAELDGLVVLRVGWQDRPVVAIADWLVPARADGAARALLRGTLATASEERCRELTAWFPIHFSVFLDLVALGFRPEPAEIWLVARSFWEPLTPEAVGPTWYYTLGDSDLV